MRIWILCRPRKETDPTILRYIFLKYINTFLSWICHDGNISMAYRKKIRDEYLKRSKFTKGLTYSIIFFSINKNVFFFRLGFQLLLVTFRDNINAKTQDCEIFSQVIFPGGGGIWRSIFSLDLEVGIGNSPGPCLNKILELEALVFIYSKHSSGGAYTDLERTVKEFNQIFNHQKRNFVRIELNHRRFKTVLVHVNMFQTQQWRNLHRFRTNHKGIQSDFERAVKESTQI